MASHFGATEGSHPQVSPFSSPGAVTPSSSQTLRQGSGVTNPSVDETNPAILCRMGQETLNEIVQRTTELFGAMRQTLQLPKDSNVAMLQQFAERKSKLEEQLKRLEFLFVRLRSIYNTVNEQSAAIAEPTSVEELLPIEESVYRSGQPDNDKSYSAEELRVIEQIQEKNQHIKKIIDLQRTLVWEINSMLAMRRTYSADK